MRRTLLLLDFQINMMPKLVLTLKIIK